MWCFEAMKSIGPFLGHLLGIGADSASIDSQAILIEVNLYSTGEFLPVISKEDSIHRAQPRRNPRRGCTGESSCARLARRMKDTAREEAQAVLLIENMDRQHEKNENLRLREEQLN